MNNQIMTIHELQKLVAFLEQAPSCTDKWESEDFKTFTSFCRNGQYDVTIHEDRGELMDVSVDFWAGNENKISFSLLWELGTTDGVEGYGPDFASLEKLAEYAKTRL